MKITINPVFQWDEEQQKYVLVSHDGQYEYDGPAMLFDRAAQKEAKTAVNTENTTAGGFGNSATGIAAPLTKQLQQESQGIGTGFSPQDVNQHVGSRRRGSRRSNRVQSPEKPI